MDRGCHRFSKRSSNSHLEWSILDSLRPRQGITGRDQSHIRRDVRHHAPERSQQPEGMGTSSWVGQSPGLSGRKGPSPPAGTEGAAGRTEEASPARGTLSEAHNPSLTRSPGPVQTKSPSTLGALSHAHRPGLIQAHVRSGGFQCTRVYAVGRPSRVEGPSRRAGA